MKQPLKYLLFFICLTSLNAYSQDVKVETIMFAEDAKIPRATDADGNQNGITTKINEAIKDRFMITSFNPGENEDFSWYDLDYEHEAKEGILLISFEGEYGGAYSNWVADDLFFDLSTGKLLKNMGILFCSLFSLNGYFDFLDKYWIAGCSSKMKEAEECGGSKPYCSLLDIGYRIENNHLTSYLIDDCFPHALRACAPSFSIETHLDSLKPYLGKFWESVVFGSGYGNGSKLDKYIFSVNNLEKAPQNYFIIGKIAGKYGFSMAINESGNSNNASGYYYYNKNKTKIPLNGSFSEDEIKLSENLNGETTGHVELYWHDSYQDDGKSVDNRYLTGKWLSPNRDKVMDIVFEEVKVSSDFTPLHN